MLSRLAGIAVIAFVMIGCGNNEEEERFRAELVERALNDDNRKAGEQFLADNAAQPKVVSLPSGLQYKQLVAGSGSETPSALDTVEVHYEGRTISGTVFDSSYQRGEPVRFPLNRVIKGWTEGLQLMSVGAQWMLYIPADLAYGARSPSEQIPPNSALVFKVELLSIEKAKEQ